MLLTEWNWDDAKEVWQEEAREEGLAEGREEGRAEGLAEAAQKMKDMGLSAEQILTATGVEIR